MKSYSGHKKEKNFFFFFLRFCMWPSVISQTTVTLFEQRNVDGVEAETEHWV